MCSKDFRFSLGLAAAAGFCFLSVTPSFGKDGKIPPAELKSPCPKDMVYVPAGWFMMGCNEALDPKCDDDEKPSRQVYLDAFCIDRLEVTTGEYQACTDTVEAKGCQPTMIGHGCNSGKPDKKQHPANCISWDRADAYCRWKGRRLPSEAEWEKAARGTDGRIYPWGNEPPTCADAVFPEKKGETGCGTKSAWKVGSKPKGASPYGAMDMAGNVLEWVADSYSPVYYRELPDRNPKGPKNNEGIHLLRGGDWWHGSVHTLRTSDRNPVWGPFWFPNWGFRCAGDPKTVSGGK